MKTSSRFLIASVAAICSLTWCSTNALAQPPKGPIYSNVRYDDDYSFVKNGRGSDPLNQLKKIPVGKNLELTFGGQYRFRFENDRNRRFGAPVSPTLEPSQSVLLNRAFLFADVQIANRFRVFGEFKYAGISYSDPVRNNLPVPVTAKDEPDVQNLFADIWLVKNEKARFGLRAGRQEMQFGKQRLISPLDWVNTRRTFDAFRLMATIKGWKADAFFAKPLDFDPENVNKADESRVFAGVYLQRPAKGKTYSAYYLALKEDDPLIRNGRGILGDYFYHTLGLGFDGGARNLDWTSEAAYQFGDFGGDQIDAYMLSFEGGYTFAKLGIKPRVGLGFDVASGDKNPGDAHKQTFNQLFPLGHAFFGWADQVGRQNIRAWSLLLTAKPHKRLVVKLNGFKFDLDQRRDALYNAGGAPIRLSASGAAGYEAGHEIDAETAFTVNTHASVLIGYTRFVPGDFIKNSGALAKTHNLFYVMVPVKF
jgi:hypothetical protein